LVCGVALLQQIGLANVPEWIAAYRMHMISG